MTKGISVVVGPSQPLDESLVPETWLRYFNGPNAGYIDLQAAASEMPWLMGASTLSVVPALNSHETGCDGLPVG